LEAGATDINSVKSPINAKIAQSFAGFFAEECQKSGHKWKDTEAMKRQMVKNGYLGSIAFNVQQVNAYAFTY